MGRYIDYVFRGYDLLTRSMYRMMYGDGMGGFVSQAKVVPGTKPTASSDIGYAGDGYGYGDGCGDGHGDGGDGLP